MSIGKYYQSGEWKGEKHVPVIDIPEVIKKDEVFDITVQVGKEIAHPNTLEHNIVWIKLFYVPEGGKFPVELGTYNFAAHGEANAFSIPKLSVSVKLEKGGKLIATSLCNIHGLWENEIDFCVAE